MKEMKGPPRDRLRTVYPWRRLINDTYEGGKLWNAVAVRLEMSSAAVARRLIREEAARLGIKAGKSNEA